MAKDLGLAANAIREGGVDAALGLAAAQMYARFAEGTGADQDFSRIVRAVRGDGSTHPDDQNATPA